MPPPTAGPSAGSASTAPTPSAGWLSEDLDTFRALRVRTVIDLRNPFEAEKYGRVPEEHGLAYHNLPIEGRRWDFALYEEDRGVARYLADRYLEVTEDGVANLRTAMETICRADSAPVVVHCAAGKDRTGLLLAIVLSLLGVAEDDIVADYALTGLATDRFIADWTARHPDGTLWPGFGLAPAEAMHLFLTDLRARHDSIESYATKNPRPHPPTPSPNSANTSSPNGAAPVPDLPWGRSCEERRCLD
ncbi:tyrosine-protein phosphatase [Nonomuraea ferruginea]